MTMDRQANLVFLCKAFVLLQITAAVGLAVAEVRPASGPRTHYGFQHRGPLFMESRYAHLCVDVNLLPFGELIRLAEEMVDVLAKRAINNPFAGTAELLETWTMLNARTQWMNTTYNEMKWFYTFDDEQDGEAVEVRVKRFIFQALIAGALGGILGGGLYGFATGQDTQRLREQIEALEYRVSNLIHVAEMNDKNIHAIDDDIEKMKRISNRMAEAVTANTLELSLVELALKISNTIAAASERLAVIRLIASMASANRVSHDVLPYKEAQKEMKKLQVLAAKEGRKLVTTDVRKMLNMEATLLPGKGGKFSIMIHVPTYSEELTLDVWKYESYAMFDESNNVNLRVKGENGYLAVTPDGRFFAELSAEAMASCHVIGKWRSCPDVKQLREDHNQSCLMSLFLGHQDQAMKLCQMHVEPVAVNVDAVGNNQFRVSTSHAMKNDRIRFVCLVFYFVEYC